MRTPGITVNPVYQMTGQHDFNEVVFEDAFMPDDHVLGEIDGAWKQATSELAYERSGRSASSRPSTCWSSWCARWDKPDMRSAEGLGRLVAQLHTLRRMSVSVNGMLQAGKEPVVEGSIVKDMGTVWEQKLPGRVRELAAFIEEEPQPRDAGGARCRFATMIAPKLTIQGGTTEDPARHHRARTRPALNARYPETAVAAVGRDHRGVVGRAACAAASCRSCAAILIRRGLSGEPQRDGGAGAQGLQDRSPTCRSRPISRR